MADAEWQNIDNDKGYRVRQATINGTDSKTEILLLRANRNAATVVVDIGSAETVQIKGHNNPNAVEAEMIVLAGGADIAADFDDTINNGAAVIQITGASTNATVITVTEV